MPTHIVLIRADWIVKGEVQKMVLVITGIETQEVLERWAFEVHSENGTGDRYICSIVQLLVRLILLTQMHCPLFGLIAQLLLSLRRKSWPRYRQSSGRSQRACRSYLFWKSNARLTCWYTLTKTLKYLHYGKSQIPAILKTRRKYA